MQFDGRKIRDEILAELKVKVSKLKTKPTLAIVWVGEDPISARYVEAKQRAAEQIGVHFDIFKFPTAVLEQKLIKKIIELNKSAEISGILVQIPLPETINLPKIVAAIEPAKDADALRFCSDFPSGLGLRLGSARQAAETEACSFRPPVTAAIFEALKSSGANLAESKVAIIGRGYLVGEPLIRMLKNRTADLRIADITTPYIGTITADADIIISAAGKPGLIKVNMVKTGAILIDAGTSEVGGAIKGDIDPAAYKKSAFYTPVPGGIGPVTVAMLYSNLVATATKFKS